MRFSALLAPTLRETPAEAETPSHKLMLRAGLIRKSSAGIYTWLPLGWRSVFKVSAIIREEMNRAGGQELMLPIVQPAELWLETGRWFDYGPEMFKLKDRHERQFCLGPTHEEIITALVRGEVRSYRQLPLMLYQIQNKYRDEVRPRFGVMRGREFVMKDAYSFDRDEAGLDQSYRSMYEAYTRIFARCGLKAIPIEADPGAIGGNATHEFVVLSDFGEAGVVHCPQCAYAANVEKAPCAPLPRPEPESPRPLEEVSTPGIKSIEDLTSFLQVPAERILKTLIYRLADGRVVAAVLRGDHTLNEAKLARLLGSARVEAADEQTVREVTGAPVGFAGPVGLDGKIPVVADPEAAAVPNAVAGANRADLHLRDVCLDRDWKPQVIGDLRVAKGGDPCPNCGNPLQEAMGIEVGQIFKLGTKYSEALGARFLDESGQERPFIMGCYGIGVTRTVAAVIEQSHDERGILWPASVAPFHAVVIPVNVREPQQAEAAARLYRELWRRGVETVYDDRDERPGVKFNDADLIGFPYRVVVGPRGLAAGTAELRRRTGGDPTEVPLDQVAPTLAAWLQEDLARLQPAA